MAIRVYSDSPYTDPCPRCGEIWGTPPRAALAAAQDAAPAPRTEQEWWVEIAKAAHDKGWAQAIEAAAQVADSRVKHWRGADQVELAEDIRALRPPAAPAESLGMDDLGREWARFPSAPAGAQPSEEDVFNVLLPLLGIKPQIVHIRSAARAVMALLHRTTIGA